MEENSGTILTPYDRVGDLSDVDFFYRVSRMEVIRLRQEAAHLHGGFWVFEEHAPSSPLGFVPCRADAHLILGRHTAADLRVDPGRGSFALRQAMLRARREEGELVLNVMDLESAQGIRLPDGRSVRALDARGPFWVQMGGLTLLFLPEEPRFELPVSLPVPEVLGVEARRSTAAPRQGLPLPSAPARPQPARPRPRADAEHCSHIREVEGARPVEDGSFIADRPSPAPTSHLEVDLSAAEARGASAFTVRVPEGRAGTLVLAREDLEVGVLLGRYDRCWSLGAVPLSNEVSRVHALLLYARGGLAIFDLGSTNGVDVDGEPTRSHLLARGQRVDLGEGLRLDVLFVGPPRVPEPPEPAPSP